MVESLTIRNIANNLTKRFDMSDASYLIYEGSVDWGSVGVSHSTFSFPDQIGEYISNTSIGTRDISINGWIIGDTIDEINNKKKELSKLINPLNDVEIRACDYTITGRPSSNVTFGKNLKENSIVAVKFLIQIFCENPMFKSVNAISVDVAEVIGSFSFPLVLKKNGNILGYRKKTLFTDLQNDGAVDVGMLITFEANGTVNNPEILNVNTHEKIRINKTLEDGEIIEINTLQGSRSVIGILNGKRLNYFKYFDFDNIWLQLPVGLSTFTYRTYDNLGERDDTYKKLLVNIKYYTQLYNLGEE